MTTPQFNEYLEHGWPLTPLKHRTKVATQKAWNLKENAVHGIAQADRQWPPESSKTALPHGQTSLYSQGYSRG